MFPVQYATRCGRWARRIAVAMGLSLLALLLSSLPARADIVWCRSDPTISLNGVPVQILTAIPQENVDTINGPISVSISVPYAVNKAVVRTDDGFNGHGESVHFRDSGSVSLTGSFWVQISVRVPHDETVPVNAGEVPVQLTVTVPGVGSTQANGNIDGTEIWLQITGS